jgi:hypothetical protein
MDAKTAPSANTDRATDATPEIPGSGRTLPQAARVLTTRAVDAATAVAGKTGEVAADATSRVGSGVRDASGRVADLARRRPARWAAIAAGITAALAAAARWRQTRTKPHSPVTRAWRRISHSTSRHATRWWQR